eukprot:m.101168 g.101168  ORF g.101168 m.101168 type:complete len:240 (-) comp51482_c0_seq1:798-1517(-)
MFRRKLQALGIPLQAVDPTDEAAFRKFVILVEDTKIRQYKIEERAELRNVDSEAWPEAFAKYLEDVNCPRANGTDAQARTLLTDWLLTFALTLEFSDNPAQYNEAPASTTTATQDLDLESADVAAAIKELATILLIPHHIGLQNMVEAITRRIHEKFSPAAIENFEKSRSEKAQQVSLDSIPVGFPVADPVVAKATKILRLLHIAELRDLQTHVNEAIVSTQLLTCNLKVDARLGKVGY